ncbi:putative magnesium transporter MRS2-G [Hibiscus syriacus]|uniref:Magnesium transporter MRS2-G n=1 Tax=Hibiscus syriacus TaxID=106335 RepID=A0A6A2ZNG9_HIBSY|nr:putative magnesium transporter MRS2-G [Hibiscus syriacus]
MEEEEKAESRREKRSKISNFFSSSFHVPLIPFRTEQQRFIVDRGLQWAKDPSRSGAPPLGESPRHHLNSLRRSLLEPLLHLHLRILVWVILLAAVLVGASIPARDLRILGPVFSHSSTILAREKAMVVNLEFIKATVTAEEVLILNPLQQEVLQFVDQLRLQLPHRSAYKTRGAGTEGVNDRETHVSTGGQWLPVAEAMEGLQCELPFEFQVLEIALEVVCSFLDESVAELERDAYPVLDELARNVSTKNLEHVRNLKSNLTRLLSSCTCTKGAAASNSITTIMPRVFGEQPQYESTPTIQKITVNIQLNNQRNELIQLQLTLTIASFRHSHRNIDSRVVRHEHPLYVEQYGRAI